MQEKSGIITDLEWSPSEEEFIVSLEESGWRLCSAIAYDEKSNSIQEPIKTCAKDDTGKTYWIYSEEERVEHFEEKHILTVRPSVSLAKNVKGKDPVFALMNCEIIDGISAQMLN